MFKSMGTNLSTVIFRGEALLILSARLNADKCAMVLIQDRADINQKCLFGRTAMWYFGRNGNVEMVRQLYSYGAEIDEPDVVGVTPFAVACSRGALAVVQFLYRISPPLATNLISLKGSETWPPLFFSMGYGQRTVSEFLISKLGVLSLTHTDRAGRTALFMAINVGSYEVANYLIRRLINLNSTEQAHDLLVKSANTDITLVWLAALNGDARSVTWISKTLRSDFGYSEAQLRNYISKVDHRYTSPLFVAVQGGHVDCARRLIEFGADVDCQSRGFQAFFINPPIVKACADGNLDMVKLLLHSGCRRYSDFQMVLAAQENNQSNVVRYLERTLGYCSRLHYAAEMPEHLILELIRCGADIECRGEEDRRSSGISPLDVAKITDLTMKERGRETPRQSLMVIQSSRPWCRENDYLYPKDRRSLAFYLHSRFRIMSIIPIDIWEYEIIPMVIARDPPLSRWKGNAISPGDGR
jgi:ankyrin repeat protein